MTKIINLWGGPGSGKSTTAASLFATMKLMGLKVELAHEFAKEVTYKGDLQTLEDQWYVTGHQANRLRRLLGKVDWVITDSPVPLGLAYATPPFDQQGFRDAVWWLHEGFDNLNVWVKRVKPYQTYGRNQTEDEALALDRHLWTLFLQAGNQLGRKGIVVDGDQSAPPLIIRHLEI